MKITPKKLSVEDFPEQQGWIGGLLSSFNQLAQELLPINSNNVTVSENLFQEIKELKFTLDAGTYPVKFRTKFNKLPQGLYCVYCVDSEGGTASEQPFPTWSFKEQQLSISALTGLTSGKTYTIKFLIIYG